MWLGDDDESDEDGINEFMAELDELMALDSELEQQLAKKIEEVASPLTILNFVFNYAFKAVLG